MRRGRGRERERERERERDSTWNHTTDELEYCIPGNSVSWKGNLLLFMCNSITEKLSFVSHTRKNRYSLQSILAMHSICYHYMNNKRRVDSSHKSSMHCIFSFSF